jgi:ubiquinone/menaquinone biosynthesis C-methylase UbiE
MGVATTRPAWRKPYAGLQMEGPIARWYAHITRGRRDYPITARAIASRLPADAAVLEVAPGPGYLAIELARLGGFRISGLDISRSFVRIASDNARQAGVDVNFRHGDVAAMPFANAAFDFVVCQAAFKNFAGPVAALDEMYRVLRPGGSASIFDLRKDAPPEAIQDEIRAMRLSPPNALLTRLTFRFGLLRAAYTPKTIEPIVRRSRFGHGDILLDGIGFELRLVKEPIAESSTPSE